MLSQSAPVAKSEDVGELPSARVVLNTAPILAVPWFKSASSLYATMNPATSKAAMSMDVAPLEPRNSTSAPKVIVVPETVPYFTVP